MEFKIHDQEVRLQKLWKSGKLVQQKLRTTTGEDIEILFAGTENFDAGPDFKDAVIKVAGVLKKGDIEVHLNANGWYEHGHHQDSGYNNVILHLISQRNKSGKNIEREDGVEIKQLVVPLEEAQKIAGASYHKLSNPVIENCLLRAHAEEKIVQTLYRAGEARFNLKVDRYREELVYCSWELLLYKKIMLALGYSKNEIPFQKLGDLLPIDRIFSEMQWVNEETALLKCQALFFGCAGLLPSQNRIPVDGFSAEEYDFIHSLETQWREIHHRTGAATMRGYDWQFFRLRPQNFPTRRLAGAAKLMLRFHRNGFLESILKTLQTNSQNIKRMLFELEKQFVVPDFGFWKKHYRFQPSGNDATRGKSIALIGKDRARDIVVNIILPVVCLHSEETGNGVMTNLVREGFKRVSKLSENTVTRTMAAQLCMSTSNVNCRSALIQQGMLHLHTCYCLQQECEECLKLSE